jgi:tRNA(Ile)-lysidine synthase
MRIAAAAGHLARAREALDADVDAFIADACQMDGDEAILDSTRFTTTPREIGLRVLARVLMQVSGSAYRPRFERLERLYLLVCEGRLRAGRTLHGCRILPAKKSAARFGPGTLLILAEKAPARRRGVRHEE